MKFTNNNLVLMLRMEWKSEESNLIGKGSEKEERPPYSLPIHFCIFTEFLCPRLLGFDDFTKDYLSSILSSLNECINVKKLICNLFFTKVLFMIKKASHKTLFHQCPVTFKILNNKFSY